MKVKKSDILELDLEIATDKNNTIRGKGWVKIAVAIKNKKNKQDAENNAKVEQAAQTRADEKAAATQKKAPSKTTSKSNKK